MKYIKQLRDVSLRDSDLVGGKSASLGEMISALSSQGVCVPDGFAITADAYRLHLTEHNLSESIARVSRLYRTENLSSLVEVSREIRQVIETSSLSPCVRAEIDVAYAQLEDTYGKNCGVAVRSSATAEDLPDASFAGQQETFLQVCGREELHRACLKAFSSLFTPRAIIYRQERNITYTEVALAICVQKMVDASNAAAGVVFTIDPDSGARSVMCINAAPGLGESVVQGTVTPDECLVHKERLGRGFAPIVRKRCGVKDRKFVAVDRGVEQVDTTSAEQRRFCISDEHILTIARYALIIEAHYQKKYNYHAMDIEWAIDRDGRVYIVQARPETTLREQAVASVIEHYTISKEAHATARVLTRGRSVGRRIVSGVARVITSPQDMEQLQTGEILVTDNTDPDWQPVLKKAAGIVTNRGGRTCHAAIVSRELGIPAIVGTHEGTVAIATGQQVTLDGSSGDEGVVYDGEVPFECSRLEPDSVSTSYTVMMNVGNPDNAFRVAHIPNEGVGLARLEFIINSSIAIHPMALVAPEKIVHDATRTYIEHCIEGYKSGSEYFVDRLASEVGAIAAAFYPKPVTVRLSDFKSNEYRSLVGGDQFEPVEENPMIGFRGASRYYDARYAPAFALECAALHRVREHMGFSNVKIMVPFVRTVDEARRVIDLLATHGLKRGENGLELVMMCELPSNVLMIDEFSQYFDGFSIGSNDLTQITLGVDRDSDLVAHIFDEQNEAVKRCIVLAIEGAHRNGRYITVCGQGPSDYPEFARWLVEHHIDALSLIPDAVLSTILYLS